LVRDLIVQRHPVFLLRSPAYLYIIIGVVLTGFVASRLFDWWRELHGNARHLERGKTVDRLLRSPGGYALELCDATGLAAFLIVGVIVAVETRAVPLLLWGPALATLTGCGGGILRDVVRADARTPLLKTAFYGEVALIWGVVFSLFLRWETWRLDETEVQIGVLVVFFGAFLTRMAAVHLRARSPSF
jgi:polar amino acid transport system substrate-binding protein